MCRQCLRSSGWTNKNIDISQYVHTAMKGKENDTRSAISTDDLGNIAFSDN